MYPTSPASLFDNFPSSPNIFDYNEDIFSFNSYSDEIPSKPDLSDIIKDLMAISITKKTNIKRTNEKKMFITKLLKNKRGRKPTKEIKIKVHTSLALDNILSKVQTHLLNFMINLINDAIINILHFNRKNLFKKFDRAKKLKISSKYFNELKNSSIKDLLENMGISKKYKKCERDINQKNLEKLIENDWFKNFFEIKFLDLFSYYYNNEQPLEQVFIDGKTIFLSEKTKSFYHLLQKYEESRNDIIRVTKMFYFDEKNTMFSEWKDEKNYKNNYEYIHHDRKNLRVFKTIKNENKY